MRQSVLETGLAVALVAAVIGTGAALVAAMHESRGLFQELELLKSEEDRLQDEWSALWIEMHTLASHSEIDAFARGSLGMVEPGERIEYVELPR
jgi:cell division protein FtsL